MPDADQMRTIIHESWELRKYDGDPPQPGETKAPVEVITWERSRDAASPVEPA